MHAIPVYQYLNRVDSIESELHEDVRALWDNLREVLRGLEAEMF